MTTNESQPFWKKMKCWWPSYDLDKVVTDEKGVEMIIAEARSQFKDDAVKALETYHKAKEACEPSEGSSNATFYSYQGALSGIKDTIEIIKAGFTPSQVINHKKYANKRAED